MSWLRRLLHRRQMESQLDKELRYHLDQHAADLIAAGCDASEAHRRARLALGGPDQVKEECRDARGTRWVEDLFQDVRYTLRTLRQKPGFAAVALLTLALGIGITTLMFTVVNGVLLRSLPYADPRGVLEVQEKTSWKTQMGDLWAFSYPNFQDCRRAARSLDTIAILWDFNSALTAPGEPENVDRREVTANLLSFLGVPLYRGRAFLPEEDRPGGAPVAIIGYSLWQRRWGGSPLAVGSRLVIDGESRVIIGITSPRFRLPTTEPDVLTPLGQNTAPFMSARDGHALTVLARLRPGATLGQARSELAVLGSQLAEQFPKTNRGRTFVVARAQIDFGDVSSTLWLLLGAVAVVLLIACVNIASLLLARAVSRERELGMRIALGASRVRLVRQCLTEAAVLGIGGGALGIALASLGLHPFLALWPGTLPRADQVQLDWRVLLFALAVSLLSSMLFGIAPALRAQTRELEQVLRAGARTIAGSSRGMHRALVISEIALAAVLLVCAGILGRTLLRVSTLDPGVNIHNVLTARMALSPEILKNPSKTRAAWDEVLKRARSLPGVEAIATVDTVPLRDGNNQIGYSTTPTIPPADRAPIVLAASVSPDYLKVTGIRLRSGRFFTDHDRLGSEGVVVIDDVMAEKAFPGQDPIGKHLWIDMGSDPVRVVGVVNHVRQWGLASDDQNAVRAQLYYPFAQVPDRFLHRWSDLMSIAVRTSVDPRTLVEPLRHALRGPTGDQVLYEVRTMEELARGSISRQRFLLLLFGIFAGLALLLACIGIYGVLAYLTSRRVPEMGVRIALGAQRTEILSLILRDSLVMIAVGAAVGLCAAFGAARLLIHYVDGVRSIEPATFVLMTVVLFAAALAASFIPARRASRVGAMQALRQE